MAEDEIRQAVNSIDLEMFMIGGEIGERILRLMDLKARQGVRVRLIHEEGLSIRIGVLLKRWLSSWGVLPADSPQFHHIPVADRLFSSELRDSPILKATFPLNFFPKHFPPPLRLAHDKILVIDGRIAIVGGMNFSSASSGNHDCVLRVTGPAVSGPAAVFEYDWRLSTKRQAFFPAQLPISKVNPNRGNNPDTFRYAVSRPHCENQRRPLVDLISKAHQRIWVETFYLTDPEIIRMLAGAKDRGLDVRIIIDPNEFSLGLPMHGAPNLSFLKDFTSQGIPYRLFQSRPGTQMHQKSVIIDSSIVYAGSTNLTVQSFASNTDSSFFIKSPRVVARFEQRFVEDWEKNAIRPDLDKYKGRKLYLTIVRFLSRFI
jgi:cardiolipin synthase